MKIEDSFVAGATPRRVRSAVSGADVVGRLGKYGLGVMKKKAQALGRQFAESFRQRVEDVAQPTRT